MQHGRCFKKFIGIPFYANKNTLEISALPVHDALCCVVTWGEFFCSGL